MLIDITRPLCPKTAVWPGDLPTDIKRVATIGATSLVTVNQLHCSLHAATHLDAPSHYDASGLTIDAIDLALLVGPCTVLHLPTPCPDPITPAVLREALGTLPMHPRLLLATHAWPDSGTFPLVFPTLSLDAIGHLAAGGVQVLGLDVPSVDQYPAKTIPRHLALNALSILILESLDLGHAPQGEYELIALPLNLPGAEASPVRAVLRPIKLSA